MPETTNSDHSERPLVIYDLDGVLTRKDSFTGLVMRRLRASPARLLHALPFGFALLFARSAELTARRLGRIAEIALSGLGEAEYAELAHEFGDRIGGASEWMRGEAVARIRAQHAAGARIVIATATEHRLAAALLERAGVPYELLSASTLEAAPRGMRIADHRIGQRKAEALWELGIPVEQAEFVTDSSTDLPTARLAGRVVLIGASSRAIRRYRQEGLDPSVQAPPDH